MGSYRALYMRSDCGRGLGASTYGRSVLKFGAYAESTGPAHVFGVSNISTRCAFTYIYTACCGSARCGGGCGATAELRRPRPRRCACHAAAAVADAETKDGHLSRHRYTQRARRYCSDHCILYQHHGRWLPQTCPNSITAIRGLSPPVVIDPTGGAGGKPSLYDDMTHTR